MIKTKPKAFQEKKGDTLVFKVSFSNAKFKLLPVCLHYLTKEWMLLECLHAAQKCSHNAIKTVISDSHVHVKNILIVIVQVSHFRHIIARHFTVGKYLTNIGYLFTHGIQLQVQARQIKQTWLRHY